jgi:ABC-type lipoprotein release transport system permease subunit
MADARLPQVAAGLISPALTGKAQPTTGRLLWNGQLNLQGLPTQRADQEFRVKVLSGRLPGPNSTTEVAVGYLAHQDPAVHVGTTIQLRILRAGFSPFVFDGAIADPKQLLSPVRVKVVGSFLSEGEFQGSTDIFIGPALYRHLLSGAGTITGLVVRLRHGSADYPAFSRGVLTRTPDAFMFSSFDEASFVRRQTHVLALALWLFAVLGALVTGLIAAQVLARHAFLEAVEGPTLRALGMTRGEVFGVSLVQFAIMAILGAVVAVATAVALSPLTPIGSLAQLAEPHPGVAFDATILLLGAVGVVIAVIVVAAIPAWRGAIVRGDALGLARFDESLRPSTLVTTVARAGLPVSAVAGVRLAVERGRGRTAVPVRSTLIGLSLSVAALIAAIVFSMSLGHLLATPRLYGWDFDTAVGSPFGGGELAPQIVPVLRSDPNIAAYGAGDIQSFDQLGPERHRVRVNMWGIDQLKGEAHPTVVAGRWPQATDEIALGSKTMRAAGTAVARTVQVAGPQGSMELRVVGQIVVPDTGFAPGLSEGAGMTLRGLRTIFPDAPANAFSIRFRPGVSVARELASLTPRLPRGATSDPPNRGATLSALVRVKELPVLLALLLALAGAATLTHTLVTSIRRRRRDLAILKTLGFVRRQVNAAVAWQSTTVAILALLVGLPMGIAAGRLLWNVFADSLGVVPEPVVSVGGTLLLVPAVLIVSNLIAAFPARSAGRTRPATVLRTE